MEQVKEPGADRKIAEKTLEDGHRNIPGWGMDADLENDPTYPIKKWNGADHERIHYERAPQQPVNMPVFRAPPGKMRRARWCSHAKGRRLIG